MAGESEPREEDAAAAWTRGRSAHPEIQLDEATFTRHLANLAPRRDLTPASLSGLPIDDLFLACACAAQSPRAADTFRARHGETIRVAIARAVPQADVAEIEQRLMSKLLVGTAASRPRIETYAGEGRLDRWLQIAAKREALMWLRERGTTPKALKREPLPTVDPELEHLREKYRGDFERALKEALDRLDDGERTLLRLHLIHGLTLEKIGKMFNVSQSTASRRLAEARESLLADVKTTLKKRLGASSKEIASLARIVASHLDLSLSHLLDGE